MSASPFASRHLVPVIVGVLYGLALSFAALRLAIPSDGTRLTLRAHPDAPGSVMVSPVTARAHGLRAGDYVIRADGDDLGEWSLRLLSLEPASPNWQFGQTVTYTVRRGDAMLDIAVPLGLFPLIPVFWDNLAIILFLLVLQVEAAWIWWQRRDQRAPQLLLIAVSSFGAFSLCWYFGTDVPTLVNAPWLILGYRLITFLILMLMCGAILHFALVLPRRRDQPPLPFRLVAGIYSVPILCFPLLLTLLYHPIPAEWLRRWEFVMVSLILASFVCALAAILYGYRHLRHSVPRLRVRVVALAFAVAALLAILYGIPILTTGRSGMDWNILPLLSLPVAFGLGIAVVFYGLFDIRVAIQRTVVWGGLTALIIGVYVLVVGTLSTIFQAHGSDVIALIATGVVAVIFHAVRVRLHAWVSHLLYGERDAPYHVVVRITQEIETTAPNELLSKFAQTVGQALKLPYSAIELCHDGQYQLEAAWGTPSMERVEFPMRLRGEPFGRFVVAPRSRGEALTAGDYELLKGLIHQAEMMIELARLNAELQSSREKLVLTREEERRRVRRDLHDGLGPALASLTLQIDAARNLLPRDPAEAEALLVSLKEQVKSALADVRRLVNGLRPPALDQLGLLGAVREQARQFGQDGTLTIELDAPDCLPPLSAALEVAAYRIITEALTNVARHAEAKLCVIRLTFSDALVIDVRDDGKGLPTTPRPGVGLRSMAERAAELGGTCSIEHLPEGGTLVRASLPYTPMEQPA